MPLFDTSVPLGRTKITDSERPDLAPIAVISLAPVYENELLVKFVILSGSGAIEGAELLPGGDFSTITGFGAEIQGSLFSQFASAWQQNVPLSGDYALNNQDFEVVCTRLGDQLIATITDRTLFAQTVQANHVLKDIIGNGENGILLFPSPINKPASVINEASARLLGIDMAEMRNMPLSSMLDSFSDDSFSNLVMSSLESREIISEVLYCKPSKKWLSLQLSYVDSGVLIKFIDITKLKIDEERYNANAKELDYIFNSSLSAMYVADIVLQGDRVIDLVIHRINKAYSRITGFDKDSTEGKRLSEVSPRTMQTDFLEKLNLLVRTQNEQILELYYPDTNTWFDYSAVSIAENKVVVTFHDITARKIAEEKLNQQYKMAKGLLDSSTNGVCAHQVVRNAKGDIVDLKFLKINRRMKEMMGLDDSVIGRHYLEIFPSAAENGLFDLCKQVIESGNSLRQEFFYNADGLNNWYDISFVRFIDDGLMVSVNDITDIKNNQQKIEEGARYLQQLVDGAA